MSLAIVPPLSEYTSDPKCIVFENPRPIVNIDSFIMINGPHCGDRFFGSINDGQREDFGVHTYASGITVCGIFKADVLEGFGAILDADGRCLRGLFEHGKCHGTALVSFDGVVRAVQSWAHGIRMFSTTGVYGYIDGHACDLY